MNTVLLNILVLIVGGALSTTASLYLLNGKNLFNINKKEEQAKELINNSENESEKIKNEINDYVQKKEEEIEHYINRKEERIKKLEESLNKKEVIVQKKEDRVNGLKLKFTNEKNELSETKSSNLNLSKKVLEDLSLKVGISALDLKDEILEEEKNNLKILSDESLSKKEDVLKDNAERTAKRIIISTIQRLSSPTSVETRAVTINVPKDHIKGKIVGRAGVNILKFEELLMVDVVFNDLPNTISISAFNLVERRIAEVAMYKLVDYSKEITPKVVENIVKKASKETDEELYKLGKASLDSLGLNYESKDLVRTVGRLQYRTSYGQNIMRHSMEVAWVCRMLGAELGLDERTCLVAGFFHDIGKAVDQDPNIKDCHDVLTKEIMEKYGFSPDEVHAAWAHHDGEPQRTPEALLVKAADAISASRPGARQESFDKYLERIQDLEFTATSYDGVKRAFAISAGRELRVMVNPEKIADLNTVELAEQIAHQVEEEITYPGKIKINVIRRTKHIELANK